MAKESKKYPDGTHENTQKEERSSRAHRVHYFSPSNAGKSSKNQQPSPPRANAHDASSRESEGTTKGPLKAKLTGGPNDGQIWNLDEIAEQITIAIRGRDRNGNIKIISTIKYRLSSRKPLEYEFVRHFKLGDWSPPR